MLRHGHLIDPERFWRKVNKAGPNGCWIWTSVVNSGGYGEFTKRVGGSRTPDTRVFRWRAHRVAYELTVGPIPEGLVLDHLCRVVRCVNPAHLEPVTQRENVRRGDAAKHLNSGDRPTYCPQGHPFDEANTYVNKKGHRHCRTCQRLAQRRSYERRRAARLAS